MQIPEHLLEKYNVAVPRYTSYPPANHFEPAGEGRSPEKLLRASNEWQPQHISLYVHIPFCKKICFYCGCNACTIRSGNQVEAYVEAVKQEIGLVAGHLDAGRKVTQLHFGGGTPNAIPVEMIASIVERFREKFDFAANAEIAIETNPAYLDEAYISGLLKAGFNRFSFGIQDLNQEVLRMVNRDPSAMPHEKLMAEVRSRGQAAVNLDFIYGLPGQTPASFRHTLEEAVKLQPDRLVTFSYAHVPWLKKHQQVLEKRGLPDAAEKTAMFLEGYDVMKSHGYEPIGLDHFVRREDELYRALETQQLHRNFQGYCTRESTGQVYAFGVSAISQLEKAYLQHTKDTGTYMEAVRAGHMPVEKQLLVTEQQQVTREVITHLMCNKQLQWEPLAASLGKEMEALQQSVGYDPEQFRMFEKDGIVELDSDSVRVTETGSLFIRNIAAALDPAYEKQVNKYSKSI